MGDICVGAQRAAAHPDARRRGHARSGVDARACVDLGATPLINTGILHREDGGQIGAGIARTPLEPIRDALRALAARAAGGRWAPSGTRGRYQRVSGPQLAWGTHACVERIPLRGDEDAPRRGVRHRPGDPAAGGAAARRPRARRGRLARAMVEEAARQLADLAPRVTVRAGRPARAEVDEPVDLIVSTATFHWILDHDALFARLHDALRPGGRLVAQCGGAGNIAAHPGARPTRWRPRAPYAAAL